MVLTETEQECLRACLLRTIPPPPADGRMRVKAPIRSNLIIHELVSLVMDLAGGNTELGAEVQVNRPVITGRLLPELSRLTGTPYCPRCYYPEPKCVCGGRSTTTSYTPVVTTPPVYTAAQVPVQAPQPQTQSYGYGTYTTLSSYSMSTYSSSSYMQPSSYPPATSQYSNPPQYGYGAGPGSYPQATEPQYGQYYPTGSYPFGSGPPAAPAVSMTPAAPEVPPPPPPPHPGPAPSEMDPTPLEARLPPPDAEFQRPAPPLGDKHLVPPPSQNPAPIRQERLRQAQTPYVQAVDPPRPPFSSMVQSKPTEGVRIFGRGHGTIPLNKDTTPRVGKQPRAKSLMPRLMDEQYLANKYTWERPNEPTSYSNAGWHHVAGHIYDWFVYIEWPDLPYVERCKVVVDSIAHMDSHKEEWYFLREEDPLKYMSYLAEVADRVRGIKLGAIKTYTLWIKAGTYYHASILRRDQLIYCPHL